MNKEELIAAYKSTFEQLTGILSSFGNEYFNKKPEAGGWSAGEIAEHLLLLGKRLEMVLLADGKPMDRLPDEKFEIIKASLEDMSVKRVAPSIITPNTESKDYYTMRESMEVDKNKIISLIGQMSTEQLSIGFPHRVLGDLSKLEWVYFEICHRERHIKQLQNLGRELIKK